MEMRTFIVFPFNVTKQFMGINKVQNIEPNTPKGTFNIHLKEQSFYNIPWFKIRTVKNTHQLAAEFSTGE